MKLGRFGKNKSVLPFEIPETNADFYAILRRGPSVHLLNVESHVAAESVGSFEDGTTPYFPMTLAQAELLTFRHPDFDGPGLLGHWKVTMDTDTLATEASKNPHVPRRVPQTVLLRAYDDHSEFIASVTSDTNPSWMRNIYLSLLN
jgi:hypothetical protein